MNELATVQINPNLRVGKDLTRVSLSDVEGEIHVGDIVIVYESASLIEGKAIVRKIEGDEVTLRVAWGDLR